MTGETRLRVLFVAAELEARGGVGRVVSGGARALAARGHDVHVAGPAAEGDGAAGFAGVAVHAWRRRAQKLAQLADLLPLLRRFAPDVVHFHAARPHGEVIAALRALRFATGSPLLVVTPHSGRPFAKRRARLGLRAADLVVVPSAWLAERVRAAGASRVAIIAAGVDPAPPSEIGREPAVLALAKLSHAKGLDVLLDAFARIAAARPAWQIWLAGEGGERDALERRARELDLAARVQFLGWIEGEAKRRALDRAAIGVLPSRRENFPGALLEMMASGLACVTSDVGAAADIAASGRAARLVPAGDAGALADALAGLIDDPAARLALGAAGREQAGRYAWPAIAAQLEAAYRNARLH
jgi:glycosyltransferase involved in cell wall biosynthesis